MTIIQSDPDAGRRRRRGLATTVVLFTTVVSHAFGRSTFGLLVAAIEDDLGLSHARAGLGGTVIYGAYLVAVITVAWAAPRLEPITIMRIGVAVGATGLLFLATVDNLASLLVGLALTGGAGAGIWITAPVIATVGVAVERRGLVIGLLSATIGIGTFCVGIGTNLWRSASGDEGAWRAVYVVEGLVAALILVGLVLAVRPEPTARVGGGFSLARLRAVPAWARLTAAYSLFAAVGAGFVPFLVPALEQDAGFSRASASSLWAFMGVATIVGSPAVGWVSDRFGRRPLLIAILAVATTATTVVALGRGWPVVVAVLVFGTVWSSFPALTAAYVRDHTDARVFSSAYSTMTIFYSATALGAPFSVGWLADRSGRFTLPFLLLAAACAVALVLVSGLPANSRAAGYE